MHVTVQRILLFFFPYLIQNKQTLYLFCCSRTGVWAQSGTYVHFNELDISHMYKSIYICPWKVVQDAFFYIYSSIVKSPALFFLYSEYTYKAKGFQLPTHLWISANHQRAYLLYRNLLTSKTTPVKSTIQRTIQERGGKKELNLQKKLKPF